MILGNGDMAMAASSVLYPDASQQSAVGAPLVEFAGHHTGLLRLRRGDDAVPVCCDVVYAIEMCHVKTLAHLYRF